MNYIEAIIEYERGTLGEQDTITLFQDLIDSGLAWKLQGHYGRTADAMIKAGLISEIVRECTRTLRTRGAIIEYEQGTLDDTAAPWATHPSNE